MAMNVSAAFTGRLIRGISRSVVEIVNESQVTAVLHPIIELDAEMDQSPWFGKEARDL